MQGLQNDLNLIILDLKMLNHHHSIKDKMVQQLEKMKLLFCFVKLGHVDSKSVIWKGGSRG